MLVERKKGGKKEWQKVKRVIHDAFPKSTLVEMDADFAFHTLYIEEKKNWLDLQMETMRVPIVQGAYKIRVRREHVLEDTVRQFKKLMPDL